MAQYRKPRWSLMALLAVLAGLGGGCRNCRPARAGGDLNEMAPPAGVGQKTWGLACLSVACAREQPEHKAELGMQVLMGRAVRVLEASTNHLWYLVQTAGGYRAWMEKGTLTRCSLQGLEDWQRSRLLIVTAWETIIREQPQAEAQPVSDVVVADLVKELGRVGGWIHVELPDHREGYLPAKAAEEFAVWKLKRRPTAENIERTARQLIGRPYLWGGDSPKGLDCSGFTRLVYYLNGIELRRNASQQAQQGVAVPLDGGLGRLQRGDLLFFGTPVRRGQPERIHHVGIYLGNKLFIQSSERVQINSLDPESPIRDEHRIRSLVRARRVLPEGGGS